MIYLNTYLRNSRNAPLDIKGRYADVLLTSRTSPEFLALLEHLDKPIYAFTGNGMITISKNDERCNERVRVSISESAGKYIFAQDIDNLKVVRKTMQSKNVCISPEILVIPLFYTTASVGSEIGHGWISYLELNNALIYTKEEPEGTLDPDVMKEPMNILNGENSAVITTKLASDSEIINAIWKLRNSINIKRVFTDKRVFWNDMFMVSGDEELRTVKEGV